MGSLTLHDGDDLDHARRYSDVAERRRRAYEACRDRDADALWQLTESYLVLHSGAGSKLSPHTRRAYRIAIELLVSAWAGTKLSNPGTDAARLYVRDLERQGLAASTIQVRLAGARALYGMLKWAGVLADDPFHKVKPARDPTPAWAKRSPYADVDVDALLTHASGSDRLLVLLGAHAGLRVAEICALRWDDIDLARHQLLVREGKGRKTRTAQVSRTLAAELSTQWSTGYVLPYRTPSRARQRMHALCDAAAVERRGVHALRHYSGTRIYRQTGRLEDAQHHLGHQNISTAQIYCHYADEALEQSVGTW